MIWVGRVFITVGALLMFFAASILMHQLELPTMQDAAYIMLTASLCLGLILLVVGCMLEADEPLEDFEETTEDA